MIPYTTLLRQCLVDAYGTPRPALTTIERMHLVQVLRTFLQRSMEELQQAHRTGAGGKEITTRRTALIDSLICYLYQLITEHYQASDLLTLIAIGGYGRGDLNPGSDIDLLFLYRKRFSNPAPAIVRDLLLLLWDLKLDLGWSNRSLADCIRWGKKDLTVKTSLIESRYLAGDRALYEQFTRSLRAYILGRDIDTYIRQKWEERMRRYASYAGVHVLLEPNVKESPGGLRDYHFALWAGTVKFGLHSVPQLAETGLVPTSQIQRVEQAYDFLLRIRNDLHFTAGRKSDVLQIGTHAEIARHLGYSAEDPWQARERFMRDYYLSATTIAQFSQTIFAKCLPPQKRIRPVSATTQLLVDQGVLLTPEEIDLQGESGPWLRQHPSLLLKLFLYQQQTSLPFSAQLQEAIRTHLCLIDDEFRQALEHRNLFMEILQGEHAAQTLRSMHELGVLAQYLPEFAPLTCLVQYDFYHRYTVDEHTLRSIEYLEALATTQERELKALARIYRCLPYPAVVKLALLLHDTGKGEKGEHVERSVDQARQATHRLGLSEKLCDQVLFLVKHHLLMNHIAQRRDIHDPKIIDEFARTVINVENLDMLYLLTYADIKAVGPGVWTVWKGALLWELYLLTRRHLLPEEEVVLTGEALITQRRQEVSQALQDRVDQATIDTHFTLMPYKYFISTPPERIYQHILLMEKLKEQPLAMKHIHNFAVGYSELMVCMPDQPGNFAKLAGILASHAINILGAQVYSRTDGIAIDTLQVESLDKQPIRDERLWQEVYADLYAILITRSKRIEDLSIPISGQRYFIHRGQTLQIPTEVQIDNRISDTHTVIEVSTYDRLGLLYLITRCLFTLGIDIYLAKISTEGNRVMDAFYITDVQGNKLLDPQRVAEVKQALIETLS